MNGTMGMISMALLAAGLLTSSTMPTIAASETDFRAAFAAAEAAEKEAAGLRNQWTTTESALAAAKKAAAVGDFDSATASAKEAEALARASVFQATSEKERWRDLEIH
jgi:multidrug resistance efflux pump